MGFEPMIAIPFFACLYVLLRQSVEKAFLNVFIPVLLLLPLYDLWKLPSMPPLSFADTAAVPLGVWLVATRWRRWKFTRMDLWVVLFAVSVVWTMFQTEPTTTPGICYFFLACTEAVIPYALGKLLIEQSGIRVAVAKRIVFLLAVVSVLSIWEFRMGSDPFHLFWHRLIPDELGGFEQFRWGFCRVSGPYAQSETTGMVFLIGTLLAYWLYKNHVWEPKLRYIRHPFTKGTLLLAAVTLGMYEDQARGPLAGIIVGFLVARTMQTRSLKRDVRKLLLIVAVVSIGGYVAIKAYTVGTLGQVNTDQGDAIYRMLLIENYMPLIQQGGWFGWGLHPPLVSGQASIDNAYLFFGVTQGYLGAGSFAVLLIEALIAVFSSIRRLPERIDREFVFCLGGCIAGLALCLGTVFLNTPVFQLVFLLLGWSQALRSSEVATSKAVEPVAEYAGHRFRRVFT